VDVSTLRMRRLTAADLPRAVDVLSRAFHDDPGLVGLLPDAKTRARVAPMAHRISLAPAIEGGQAYGVGEPLEGIAIWELPGQGRPTPVQYLRAGALRVLFSPLLLPVIRSGGKLRALQAMHKRHAPRPHHYLSVLAVAPESQGKGLASRLVKPMLAQADGRSLGVYLETMKARNVAIYEHFGFVCVEEYHVPKTDLTVWALYRPPKA
jgi:GNAT superfamily N-acetyltransferase